ncbi:MAG: hypothetical protein DI570_09925 [Phenylobacterium zucineum]|nr:MAG: hypothetical protein DI570_09925 [Phenylobacterium zucineum]
MIMSAFASRPAAVSLAATLAFCLAGPADAQSFLKSLAREAAQRAAAAAIAGSANQAQQPAQQQQAVSEDDDSGGSAPSRQAESVEVATTGPAPWPSNAGSASVKGPRQLQFSAELEQQKKDFVEWSKVRCSDCEGGYSYDAWAQHFVRLDGSWKAWEKKLGALAMGESVTWQGSTSKGQIKVVGETPIRDWPCKQLEWSLTRGTEKLTRPGLICAAPEGASGAMSWNVIL